MIFGHYTRENKINHFSIVDYGSYLSDNVLSRIFSQRQFRYKIQEKYMTVGNSTFRSKCYVMCNSIVNSTANIFIIQLVFYQ